MDLMTTIHSIFTDEHFFCSNGTIRQSLFENLVILSSLRTHYTKNILLPHPLTNLLTYLPLLSNSVISQMDNSEIQPIIISDHAPVNLHLVHKTAPTPSGDSSAFNVWQTKISAISSPQSGHPLLNWATPRRSYHHDSGLQQQNSWRDKSFHTLHINNKIKNWKIHWIYTPHISTPPVSKREIKLRIREANLENIVHQCTQFDLGLVDFVDLVSQFAVKDSERPWFQSWHCPFKVSRTSTQPTVVHYDCCPLVFFF